MTTAVVTGTTVLKYSTPPIVVGWRSLYSDVWAGAPRQKAKEFCEAHFSDCGAPNGLPDQWYFYRDPWIKMTEVRARWLFEVQCLAWKHKRSNLLTPAELKYAYGEWVELFDGFRCFTNGTGTTSHHDYITGANPAADPMLYQLLLLAGNRVDVLGEDQFFPENYFGIQKSYPHRLIRAVDLNQPLPAPEAFLEDPYICHICTTIKPDGTHGRFPQFDGEARCVVWAPGGSAYVWTRIISNE